MGNMGKSPDDLISVKEASKELGVKPRQVRNMIVGGLLPAQQPGGRDYVIRRGDLSKVPKVRKRGPKPKAKS